MLHSVPCPKIGRDIFALWIHLGCLPTDTHISDAATRGVCTDMDTFASHRSGLELLAP